MSLLPIARAVAASTVGMDLVPVVPMAGPSLEPRILTTKQQIADYVTTLIRRLNSKEFRASADAELLETTRRKKQEAIERVREILADPENPVKPLESLELEGNLFYMDYVYDSTLGPQIKNAHNSIITGVQ